jgi:putative tricarboxylic transport membrane protein
MVELFIAGFGSVFTLQAMVVIILGVAVGIIFGAIPGLTATMAVALCLPISFGMGPMIGVSLLVGLYIGGVSGGLISAILLKIPGTPSSIATTFDGGPMAQKGEAGKALGTGIVFSFFGGLIGFIALIFISPPLAEFALKFGPYEYFSIAVFSLTMIASLAGESLAKGIASGLLGMVLAMVGIAPIDALPRFTFGLHDFDGGFNILPAMIGLFAISEILKTAEVDSKLKKGEIAQNYSLKGFGFSLGEFVGQIWNMIRSAAIGLGIGILPGIGGGTANILAYLTAKNQSKHPEKFGTGIMDGVVASEASNNAAIGGAMIPLLTLGIPGDTVTAMLLGGLMIHGLTPGPLLFQNSGKIVYGIFAALLVANLVMLIMEFYGLRVFVKLLRIPKHILLPVILALCVVGAYGLNNRVFDVWTILLFGLLGYVLEKFKFPLAPIVIGFILGPMAETNFRRGLQFSNGSFTPFLTHPISVVFLGISVISIILTGYNNYKKRKAVMVKTVSA